MLEKNLDGSYEVDLAALFKALWRKIWIIIAAAVVCGAAFFAYSKIKITPTYSASSMLYVNTSSTVSVSSYKLSTSDMSAGSELVTRYIVILGSRSCLNEVIAEAGLDYSYGQLKGMVSAAAVDETEIFQVTVTSSDPEEAALIANTVAEVLPKKISDIISGTSVNVVDYAVANNTRVAPSYTKYAAIGVVVGAVLSALVIIVLELLDDIIHTEEYITESYPDIPLLSSIPDLTSKGEKNYYKYGTKNRQLGGYMESFNNVKFGNMDDSNDTDKEEA